MFHMGMKRIDTVGDLCRFGANLRLVCRCGHLGVIDGHELHYAQMRRRWPSSLATLISKLKCSRCGSPPREWSPSPHAPTRKIGRTAMERRVQIERAAADEASRASDEA